MKAPTSLRTPLVLIVIALVSGAPARAQSPADAYTGNSDFKLFLFDRSANDTLDFNEDVLAPNDHQANIERVRKAMFEAAEQSMLPMMGDIKGTPSGTEPDFLSMAMKVASQFQGSLNATLGDQFIDKLGLTGPVTHEILLTPWSQPNRDYFYRNEKVSTLGAHANFIGLSPSDPKFGAKVTSDIQAIRQTLANAVAAKDAKKPGSGDPAYLLAYRSVMHVDPDPAHRTDNVLKVYLLLGLKPQKLPFAQTNDQVTLDKITIPAIPAKSPANAALGPVALVRFDFPLYDSAPMPSLSLEFGDFLSYASTDGGLAALNGGFGVVPLSQKMYSPRFEGTAKLKGHNSPIAINFNFQQLTFDLTKAKLSDLKILTSPGLRIGATNWVLGGFGIQSIDTQFQTQINQTINDQLEAAKKSGVDQASKKITAIVPLPDAAVQQALTSILGRAF